jgi:hypothetical protein
MCRNNIAVEARCEYRLTNESIPFMLPYLTKRVVKISEQELQLILKNKEV